MMKIRLPFFNLSRQLVIAVVALEFCAGFPHLVQAGNATSHFPSWVDLNTGFPDLDSLPLLRHGVQTRQFCSYDRSGDNYDHEYFPLYMEPNGECVIFDAYGPGCLYRHHMNLWQMGVFPGDNASRTLEGVKIRYYFDGETAPRIDMDVSVFFSTNNPLGIFKPPLADDGGRDYRLLYHPMFFKKHLKVALSEEPGGPGSDRVPWTGAANCHPQRRSHWYQYTYQLFLEDPGIQTWSAPPNLDRQVALWTNPGPDCESDPESRRHSYTKEIALKPGEAQKVLGIHGRGAITWLELRLQPMNRESLFGSWLRIYWDGAKIPAVDAPIGAFFGAHPDRLDATYASLLVGYAKDGRLYCRFPMPFWKSARIEVENRSASPIASLKLEARTSPALAHRYPPGHAGYFRAAYAKQMPRTEGRDFIYLNVSGAGHVVGHTANRWDTSMEENERTYFDNSRTPEIQGDGFEDDQGFGWGLKERSMAVYGAPVAQGGSGSLYRFFIPDLYVFHSAVRHGHITYGPSSPRGHEGFYKVGSETSVSYFYATDQPLLKQTDELDFGNPSSESAHKLSAAGPTRKSLGTWWYDGEFNNVLFSTPAITDDSLSISGHCEFTVTIDKRNEGVRLRLRTDKENNRQLARVFVDGELVTERPWYTVDFEKTYRDIRWADSDFNIPAKYTQGKKMIRLRLEHAGSESGYLDAFRLWVFSYTGL